MIAGGLIALSLFVSPVSNIGSEIAAQDASPAVSLGVADPSECVIEPRPLEDFVALTEATPGVLQSEMQGIAVATPIMPTGGVPADPAIVAAVTATVDEQTACLNAGDIRRYTAFYTDEAFFLAYGGGSIDDPETFEQQLASLATPQPLPPEQRVRIPAVSDVRVLPDGRVTAILSSNGEADLSVFSESGGRYLFDWSYVLASAATPTP